MSALTKIFIVLQLVCSLALAVLIALMVSRQDNYKVQVSSLSTQNVGLTATAARLSEELSARDGTIASLGSQLKSALDDKNRSSVDAAAKSAQQATLLATAEARNVELTNTVASANATSSLLSSLVSDKDKELTTLRPQVAELTKKYAEVNRLANDLKNALASAELAIRKLQEQIVVLESTPKTGAGATAQANPTGLTGGAQTVVPINGKITKIGESAGKPQIEVPLGTRDGLQVNTKLVVYREVGGKQAYLGEALVQRVAPDQAVAVITFTKPGETVQAGDLVMSGLGN